MIPIITQMPLDVDRGIELPQLELTHNFTGDCTTAYSTGCTIAILIIIFIITLIFESSLEIPWHLLGFASLFDALLY